MNTKNHFFTDSLLFSILFHHFFFREKIASVSSIFSSFVFFQDWSLMTCGNSSSTTFTYVHTFQLIIVDFSLEKYNQKDDDQKDDDDDDYFCSSSRWILWFLCSCPFSHTLWLLLHILWLLLDMSRFWLAFDSLGRNSKKHKKGGEKGGRLINGKLRMEVYSLLGGWGVSFFLKKII